MTTALVILIAVVVALAVYRVLDWLAGPEDEEPWFPENHWRLP